jgi:hypothetical protein
MTVVSNKIVPASKEMEQYACRNYHYSRCLPVGRRVSFAIFEESEFIGVIIYSLGASPYIGNEFGLRQGEIVELTRVALKEHKNYVSYYLAKTLRMLREVSPSVKMVVSFSDIEHQEHHGGIYQATNWIYLGVSILQGKDYYYKGKWTTDRHINTLPKRLRQSLKTRPKSNKHKYIYVFDKRMRKKYIKVGKPYPKSKKYADMV